MTVFAAAAMIGASSLSAYAVSASRSQWYLSQFQMSQVWQTTKGAGVKVAILGTGVDPKQQDVAAALTAGIDLSSGSALPTKGDVSPSYDGTQVAALIAGQGTGASGVQGLAPKATVMPIQVMTASENEAVPYHVALGVGYAVSHGARVILVQTPELYDTTSIADAIKSAVDHGAVVIATSGNDHANVTTSPCDIKGVVCVAGTTKENAAWPGSTTGKNVALAAPADQLPVPTKTGFVLSSSTHYSSALAAGEAALVWSAHPSWTAGQIIRAMIHNTTSGNAAHVRVNDQIGYGIINPLAATTTAAPSETTNPFLPLASPSPSTKAPATHSSAPVSTASSGSGTSATPWIAAGGAAVAAIVVVGLVWWLIRRRSRGEGFNYAYGTSYYDRPSPGSRSGSYPVTGYPQGEQPPDSGRPGQEPFPQQIYQRQEQPLQQPPVPPGYTAPYAGAPDPANPDWRNTIDTTRPPVPPADEPSEPGEPDS